LEESGERPRVDVKSMESYYTSMKMTVSEKGQVTIPKKVRERLGLKPGSVLEVSANNGRLVAVKADRGDPFSKWRGEGSLPSGLSVDEYLNRSRG